MRSGWRLEHLSNLFKRPNLKTSPNQDPGAAGLFGSDQNGGHLSGLFYHFNNLPTDILSNPSFFNYLNYGIEGLASAGVPLFFMVNGALMLNRSYNLRKHVRKIIAICILTVVWGILTLAILIPIKGDSYTAIQFAKALVEWKQFRIFHLWFLQTLVCLYILFPLIKGI